MNFLRKINRLLRLTHRKQLIFLSIFMIISGFFEILGVSSIMPFIGIVVDPKMVNQNRWLVFLYDKFGFDSSIHFLMFLGFLILSIICISNAIVAFTMWRILNFSFILGKDLSETMFGAYLNFPYQFFLNRNSSDFIQNTVWEISRVVTGVVIPCLTIVARLIIAFSILGLLVWINPFIAMLSGLILGGSYSVIYLLARKSLSKIGIEITNSNFLRNKIAYETFGGIKDIKILGREYEFFEKFKIPINKYSRAQAKSQMIFQLPRYALETLAFGGIILIVIFELNSGKNLSSTLPMISVYALAGYRLMPTLQQIFANISNVRFNIIAVDQILKDLDSLPHFHHSKMISVPRPIKNPMPFSQKIVLDNVDFRYLGRNDAVLDNVSLTIPAKTTVGIVGSTGSGKTTLLDILLGLLMPISGRILVDGVDVGDETRRNWQANIGYVPQQIMLLDDTVLNNIAFGIPEMSIDKEKVEKASKLAHLHDFVVEELQNGYETEIGERGIRLSGGQRQRIGIARALYHDPPVLVLDEATSALDNMTENVIMEAIKTLSRQKTIIMVAHRLSTVRECDILYFIEKGKIVDKGSFNDMVKRNKFFKIISNELENQSSKTIIE